MRSLVDDVAPIFDIMHDGVVMIDSIGVVCYVHKANERITAVLGSDPNTPWTKDIQKGTTSS